MKKAIAGILCTSLVLCFLFGTVTANAKGGGYCVVDGDTGIVLFGGNENLKLPMASTTKIMTAITVIENVDNLDEEYKIPKSAVGVEGSSVYLQEGESVTLRELLYCLMLRSGNDSAVALAVITSGSVEGFCKEMNLLAKDIGAKNTNFANPHGLHDENHFTTASDLAKITAYAMKNPTFRDIVSSEKYVGKRTTYYNKNKLLKTLDGCDGVKTGYTKNAGRCLVSSATRDGHRVISVVLNCPEMYEFSKKVIDKAFLEYDFVTVYKKGEIFETEIEGIKNKKVKCSLSEDLVLPIKKGEATSLNTEIELQKSVELPVNKGEIVGNIKVFDENDLLFCREICTIEKVGILDLF